jgi:energy-coupling factor transporter ATP-binding protein EcfA2
MSFEQRKRVSIGVELAANPSILFLDEPTTGLDSLAAQALVRNLRTVASTGRSIVCTIHQPSALIFHSFDSLLLLKRGGQTVFFGPLGEEGQNLINFFESAPGVDPMPKHINPATWMLDVIGAGVANHSSSSSATTTNNTEEKQDFHDFYQHSSLSMTNQQHLAILCEPNEYSRKLNEDDIQDHGYNATYLQQYFLLLKRIALLYYRTPTYSIARIISNIVIALIFGSAYPQQSYDTYVGVISRSAVIFITSLFCAVLAMLQITPVLIPERAVFYREQSSRMYSVFIYCLTLVTIEIPCLIISALAFTLPFFYVCYSFIFCFTIG